MSEPTSNLPAVPDFTPVPRRPRADGLTPDRQRTFIEALADCGSVTHAARRTGKSPESFYQLRRQPGAESFRAAWDAALAQGVRTLTDLAIDRAKHGVPVPIMYKGEQVGERRRYNDRLLMWILRHHQPETYGEAGARPTREDGKTPQQRRADRRLEELRAEERKIQDESDRDEFAHRLRTMAERMAEHDPALHLGGISTWERFIHLAHRIWPPKSRYAADEYVTELARKDGRLEEWLKLQADIAAYQAQQAGAIEPAAAQEIDR